EINGKTAVDVEDPATKAQLKAGNQLPGFAWLKDDGTTSCGNWIYCGSFTEAGNLTARRDPSDPSGMGVHQNWAWSWPANRRVLYNRASCDLDGKPWDASRRQVWWSEPTQKWVGNDVTEFKADSKPADHLVPEPFVEIPAELANDMGLRGGEVVKVSSARGEYIAKAMVTKRIKPMTIDGKRVYQIGLPIHWGYRGIAEDEGKTARTPANSL